MKNVEHRNGHEHVSVRALVESPAQLEAKSCAEIEALFTGAGYTHINAAETKNSADALPLSALVRTADGKIIHVGLQNKKQYWLNVIVEDSAKPTEIEKRMVELYTNGYRGIGNVAEGTEFEEYAARNVTGVVGEKRVGVVEKLRGIFSSAA